MTSRDFVYWLQGLFELSDCDKNKVNNSLSIEQTACIRNHLAMVFKHEIDPSFGNKVHQQDLAKIHSGIMSAGSGDVKFNC